MKRLLTATILMFLPKWAWCQQIVTIFEVRKTLAMSDADPVYRDFYINGGSEVGLTQGSIITVRRRIPLYDSYQNRSAGDLEVRVAKVKLVHVQRGLAVARLYSEFSREQSPLLEDNYIMVGDLLDLGSATAEKNEKKSASNEENPVMPAMATAKNEPQILVNSVELSSESISAKASIPSPDPGNVDLPVLQ